MKKLLHILDDYNELIVDPTDSAAAGWDVELIMEDSDSGELSFRIGASNPCFDTLVTLRSEIAVVDDECNEMWRGRVWSQECRDFCEKLVVCKGAMDYLHDGVIPAQTFSGTAEAVLSSVISCFNRTTVESKKRFTVGIVDGIGEISHEMDAPQRAWDLLADLLKGYGGSLNTRRDGDVILLDWRAEGKEHRNLCSQTLQWGVNLLSYRMTVDGDDIATVLRGHGKEGLTFAAVNDGDEYVVNEEAAAEFGYIEDVYRDIACEDPAELLAGAKKELAERVKEARSVEVSAVDLSVVDPSVESLTAGDYARLLIPERNIDEYVLVKKIHAYLYRPQKTKITLAASLPAASRIIGRNYDY